MNTHEEGLLDLSWDPNLPISSATTVVIKQAAPNPTSSPHGALEVLEVIKKLEAADIPCCIVGVSALKYYGAHRMRNDWDLCVPDECVSQAADVIRQLTPWEHLAPSRAVPCSLHHTYDRYGWPHTALSIAVMPAYDAHIECLPTNFERSHQNLPYPKLDVLAQSLLDTFNLVDLDDLVDGMDLQDAWGEACLRLDGTVDVSWAERQNEKIHVSVDYDEGRFTLRMNDAPRSREELWHESVRNKGKRIGAELPEGYFTTRFRAVGSPDPRENTLRLAA